MRALTISQPYASLIGPKWVENRRWRTPYRGTLLIHAGGGTQYLTREEMAARGLPTGVVVAVARLAAVYSLADLRAMDPDRKLIGCDRTAAEVLAHEHAEGPECWILTAIRRVETPIPCRGAQGLWFPPTNVVYAARLQLGSLE